MQSVGVLLALTSALAWGGGDFLGGLATRRSNQFHVLARSAFSGFVVLLTLALLFRETLPSAPTFAWAAGAGMAGAISITALYRGLAIGNAATVAPTAAVVTAALPAAFGSLTAGLPRPSQLIGFALALAGMWLVARTSEGGEKSVTGLKLALVAGTGAGGFLILIAQVNSDLVFAPLAVARTATLATAFILMFVRGIPLPSPASNSLALLAGVLDAGGNVFYLLARQHTRLDVAAVLSSLYPVGTIVLARVVLKDPVTRTQWTGACICLVAVGLITI